MTLLEGLELTSVLLSLTFLVLLIRENKWCWPFGIISSLLSIYVFYEFKLYSEAVLFIYYVLIGFYGWYVWNSRDQSPLLVTAWSWVKHIPLIVIGSILSFLLGLFFKTQTDAARSYIDSTTTIFSFLASYLEAHKIFSSWIFWVAINGISIWLYYDRGLKMYAFQAVIYFGVSIFGLIDWGRKSGVITR